MSTNPSGVRFPKGMRPLVQKYAEQIARLARETVASVTGLILEQWSPDTEPLGAGSWGVVWPLADERFILKVTADPTEGPIVSTIMSDPYLHNHQAVLHYFALRQIPESVVFRNKEFPLYVIVAERLKHVSEMENAGDMAVDVDHFWRALYKLKTAAGALVRERARKRPRSYMEDRLYEEWSSAVSNLRESPLEDFIWNFYDATRTDDGLGGVLADLHYNNVGKRVVDWTDLGIELSPSKDWVINDPGHSSLAEKPTIEVLKNPKNPKQAVVPLGDCFAWATKTAERLNAHGGSCEIVHALVKNTTPRAQRPVGERDWYEHAWVEHDGLVLDFQTEAMRQEPLTLEEFYDAKWPKKVRRYDLWTALKNGLKTGHHGPWA